MPTYTNLQNFLDAKDPTSSYRYTVANTRHMNVLMEHALFAEYTNDVVRKLKGIETTICKQFDIPPLYVRTWNQIRKDLLKLVSSLKGAEKIHVSMVYQFSQNFDDFNVELYTLIR